MWLSSLQVVGFQSFADSGLIELGRGLNLIVGANNVGKSCLIRALEMPLADDRHRNAAAPLVHTLSVPYATLGFKVSGAELKSAALQIGGRWAVGIRPEHETFDFDNEIFEKPEVVFNVKSLPNNEYSLTKFPSFGIECYSSAYMQVIQAENGSIRYIGRDVPSNRDDNLVNLVSFLAHSKMFIFKPERYALGEAEFAYADTLSQNASNLAPVLSYWQGARGSLFRKLVDHIREIFSTVGALSVINTGDRKFEIRLWPTESQEQPELSFPLSRSGTGVAQAIAILTAVMSTENSIIVIDEVNSFLHPAAVKTLLRIIQTHYLHHQYIISTHAAEVISYGNLDSVLLVTRDGYESVVNSIDLEKLDGFRIVADHIGVSLQDVFAAEHIIWVEGQTEYLCFPYIYTFNSWRMPTGTVISKVANTGDFFGKKIDPDFVYSIYERLASASEFMLASASFSFDPDDKKPSKIADIVRASGGRVSFLPRRNFECCLIHPAAIAAFIGSQYLERIVTEDDVRECIISLANERKHCVPEWNGDVRNEGWLRTVNAPVLIDEACGILSNHCVTFRKADDSLYLVKFILQNDSDFLAELVDYVRCLVDRVAKSEA